MTLNAITLEEYFFVINQPKKEKSMFEYLKNKWTELMNTRYEFIEEPVAKEQDSVEEGWAFVMRTGAYKDVTGEIVPAQEDIIAGDNDGTWGATLDQILDVMGYHYGYNIKEQVYYSVQNPLNIEGESGYGRALNDEVLQHLFLAYPEVYDPKGHVGFKL
jgi:hypothetical protein